MENKNVGFHEEYHVFHAGVFMDLMHITQLIICRLSGTKPNFADLGRRYDVNEQKRWSNIKNHENRHLKRPHISANENGRGKTNIFIPGQSSNITDVGADIFRRGLCLSSDNKMTAEEQNVIIDVIHRCFKRY